MISSTFSLVRLWPAQSRENHKLKYSNANIVRFLAGEKIAKYRVLQISDGTDPLTEPGKAYVVARKGGPSGIRFNLYPFILSLTDAEEGEQVEAAVSTGRVYRVGIGTTLGTIQGQFSRMSYLDPETEFGRATGSTAADFDLGISLDSRSMQPETEGVVFVPCNQLMIEEIGVYVPIEG